MGKKAIAALLLVVIAAWAEMTMAPMLAMHAGHMRPGHEMVADMPAQHAGHNHAGHQHSAHDQAIAGLPCCPGLHKMEPADMLELVSGSPACDDPHSCCFRQGPQNVPAPASDVQRQAREMAPVVAQAENAVLVPARRTIRDCVLAVSPPPDLFGMTLRV